jgi:chromatin segregation and condensation protein Rec8/ScpA/Scc1 (kleisin family)
MSYYDIKIDLFEGPLDLLLYLVQKQELDPTQISIVDIADPFIAIIEKQGVSDLGAAAEFLVMASRLMALKVKELLPKEEEAEKEDLEFDVEREELIKQMMEYRLFKEASFSMQELEECHFGTLGRGRSETLKSDIKEEEEEAGVFELYQSFLGVLRKQVNEAIHTIEVDHVTIEDCQQSIESQLALEGRALFSELLGGRPDLLVASVTFMALLEMVKLDQVLVRQNSVFDEMRVYRRKDNLEFSNEMISSESYFSKENLKEDLAGFIRSRGAPSSKSGPALHEVLKNFTNKSIKGQEINEQELTWAVSGEAPAFLDLEYWMKLQRDEFLARLANRKKDSIKDRKKKMSAKAKLRSLLQLNGDFKQTNVFFKKKSLPLFKNNNRIFSFRCFKRPLISTKRGLIR